MADIQLSYENGIKILQDNGINLSNNHPTPEYISFDTGLDMWYFNVNNEKKLISITKHMHDQRLGIPSTMSFKLWEEEYTDIIYPGKIEIIHKSTLVRSTRYCNHNGPKQFFPLNHHSLSRIEHLGFEFGSNIDNEVIARYPIETDTLAMLPFIHYGFKKEGISLKFEPYSKTMFGTGPVVKFQFGHLQSIHLSDSFDDKDDLWLVYTKLDPCSFYVTKTYTHACKLMAKLKYGDAVPTFMCGVSVFEDYYVMPLYHNKVSMCDENMMMLSNPIEKYLTLEQGLATEFDL